MMVRKPSAFGLCVTTEVHTNKSGAGVSKQSTQPWSRVFFPHYLAGKPTILSNKKETQGLEKSLHRNVHMLKNDFNCLQYKEP